MNRFASLPLLAITILLLVGSVRAQDTFRTKIKPFLDAYCVVCHGPDVKKAGLRLDELNPDFVDPKTIALWIKAHDKIVTGAMPPKQRERPPQRDLDMATQWLHKELHT